MTTALLGRLFTACDDQQRLSPIGWFMLSVRDGTTEHPGLRIGLVFRS